MTSKRGRPMVATREFLAARYTVDSSGCWLWTGTVNPVTGYSQAGKRGYGHRMSYVEFVGPIPDGMTIDHLCRVRSCVNPDHLEAVSLRENILRSSNAAATNARKKHCAYGHPLDQLDSNGRRRCGPCVKARWRLNADKLRRGEPRGSIEWYLNNPARVYVRKEMES